MKTYAARDAKNKFGEVLDEAQHQPVTVTRNGRPIGAVVNMRALEKLLELERREAQKEILKNLKVLQSETKKRPKPTRAQLRDVLGCDDSELDTLFDPSDFSDE